jgi:hypothetical protein
MGLLHFLAVDPGTSGGWAIMDESGGVVDVRGFNDPQDVLAVGEWCRNTIKDGFQVVACIEQVWASPVMGPAGAFTFGENYGQWCAGLRARGIPMYSITPQRWQRVVASDITLQGAERKRALKALAERLAPTTRVTLATADALLLAHYCLTQHRLGREIGTPVIP